jgi:transposase
MSRFKPVDRKTASQMPPSLEDWLPENHLARFIVEVVEGLDLGVFINRYAKGGGTAYHPGMLLSLLLYGYATGTFSSRRIERATYDSVAFRYIAAGEHPDHDTLATFRRQFLNELTKIFVQVLELAKEMNLLKLGRVSLDGTKIHANASKHSALSYGHIEKIETKLKTEVQEMLVLAEQTDKADVPDGVVLPDEIKRREARLACMAEAKAKIEARAKEEATGKKPGGKPPAPPVEGPHPKDQVNLTDEDSRIMKVSGGGFEQAYNAQAAVDTGSLLIVAPAITQATNDKEQIEPMLEQLTALPQDLGQVEQLIADTGYYSEKNVHHCEAVQIEPLIALSRQDHHPDWRKRHEEAEALPIEATPLEKMKHRLKTKAGRAIYALRKQTVEPVFGIIKSVMGFRQFLLRGLDKVRGEWNLVCLAWNLKRMAVLRPA